MKRSAISSNSSFLSGACMLHSRRIAPAALLALFSLVSGGGTGAAARNRLPEMTIKIYNNSDDTNIYPLISFPGQGSIKDGEPGDKWMQGFFGITQTNQHRQI